MLLDAIKFVCFLIDNKSFIETEKIINYSKLLNSKGPTALKSYRYIEKSSTNTVFCEVYNFDNLNPSGPCILTAVQQGAQGIQPNRPRPSQAERRS